MEDPEAAAEVGKEAANTAVKSQPEKMIHTPTPSSQTSLDPQEGKSDSPVHADEANKNDVENDNGCSDLNLLDILPQDYEIQDLLEKSKNLTNYSKQTYCIRLPKCVYNFRRRLNNYFMETFADASVQRDVIYPLVEGYRIDLDRGQKWPWSE